MKSQKTKKTPKMTAFILGFVLFALLLIATSFLGNPLGKKDAETTSKEPSAQSGFSDGKKREIILTDKNEGVVIDTGGEIPIQTSTSDWSTSRDGAITVHSPAKESLLSNGQSLAGESTADRVSFRIMDDVSGVIAQGSIGVYNNKFSGKLNFETNASEGRLDLFLTDDEGVESSIVEIAVRFK